MKIFPMLVILIFGCASHKPRIDILRDVNPLGQKYKECVFAQVPEMDNSRDSLNDIATACQGACTREFQSYKNAAFQALAQDNKPEFIANNRVEWDQRIEQMKVITHEEVMHEIKLYRQAHHAGD